MLTVGQTLDMPKLTLPKCIDPRNQRVTADGLQGEAGRLVEGLVLGLYMGMFLHCCSALIFCRLPGNSGSQNSNFCDGRRRRANTI